MAGVSGTYQYLLKYRIFAVLSIEYLEAFVISFVELNLPTVGGYDFHHSVEKFHLCRNF